MQNIQYPDNSDLKKIIKLIDEGHNLFITGSAGTGKSFILKALKKHYDEKLTLTSTTGVAAVNIQGVTIHSWADVGIMDIPVETLISTINEFDICPKSKCFQRIKKCKILAIDEISMLSAFDIEYLNEYFKAVRKSHLPFGGMQVIFIGDFLQLPPVVRDEEKKVFPRKALFCFQSSVWDDLCLKNILLTKIYRQKDSNFSEMLQNFRIGSISAENMKLLSTRFTNDSFWLKNKLHLFPKKIQAKEYNETRLRELKTPLFEFEAMTLITDAEEIEDLEERIKYRRKIYNEFNNQCPAEKLIKLKVGCRVMLLKNIDFNNGLINGSCGTVLELKNSYAVVKFDNNICKKIGKCLFEYYNVDNELIGKRFQLPLKLAYAITIHKSQGLTLDEIVIDCFNSFSPGQVYVGLSRVKSLNGLHIIGFNPKKLYPSAKARAFYMRLEEEQMDNIKNELFIQYL